MEDGLQDALGRSRIAPAPAGLSRVRLRSTPSQQQRALAPPPRGPLPPPPRPLSHPPALPATGRVRQDGSETTASAPADGARDAPGRFSSLGDRLIDLRKAMGITQVEVARRMGSTQPAMARIEKGEMKPNLRTLARYGEAIGQLVQVEFKPQASGLLTGDEALEKVTIDAVPEALASVRRKLGLTQAQVATAMETSQPVIARLESGEAVPNLRTLERYCEALAVDPVFTFEAITAGDNSGLDRSDD